MVLLFLKKVLTTLYCVGTVYHAVPAQTDSSPRITAANYYIEDIHNPPRYVAVPQDWIGRVVEFGDEVQVECDCYVEGKWIVGDVMNARYNGQKRVDFLVPPTVYDKYYIKLKIL